MRKLNSLKLMVASALWCLDIDSLTMKDLRSFLEHIYFISVRAMTDLKDSAHVAIRKKAEVHGFTAFSEVFNGSGVVHCGPQSMKTKKGAMSGRKACFHWNKELGCP